MKLARLLLAGGFAVASLALHAQTRLDEITAQLQRQDYVALETSFAATQQRFERGELTEHELRQAFEPFEKLRDEQALAHLRDWAAQSPASYVAHLALGLNYRAQGSDARGTKSWKRTPQEGRDGLVNNFTLAEPELRKSIPLTAKPYLSLLNMMSIAGNVQNRPFLNASLLLANDALPANELARLSYARYLLPRWGGSYERYDAFVAMSRAQGVAEGTLLKLQAVAMNDRGSVQFSRKDAAGAAVLFKEALQLANRAGDDGSFRAAYLSVSVQHLCKDAPAEPACEPAAPGAAGGRASTTSTDSGPPGGDLAHAVPIPTSDGTEGVRTEYAWLALRYPGYRRTSQALIPTADKRYDMLAITTADGRELKVYFDITAFLGPALPADTTFFVPGSKT